MNLKYYYWYFNNAIPEHVCDQITKFGLEKSECEQGIIGDFSKKIKEGKTLTEEDRKRIKIKRDSIVSFFSEPWVYNVVHPFVRVANTNAGWSFDWDFTEACQFTEYAKNQFYDWHCDSWDAPYDEPENLDRHNKMRKLSVSCLLTDPKEYEGGDLEFKAKTSDGEEVIIAPTEAVTKGAVIVFPSFVWHRVKPVTKGIRRSLVMWNLGYPFR